MRRGSPQCSDGPKATLNDSAKGVNMMYADPVARSWDQGKKRTIMNDHLAAVTRNPVPEDGSAAWADVVATRVAEVLADGRWRLGDYTELDVDRLPRRTAGKVRLRRDHGYPVSDLEPGTHARTRSDEFLLLVLGGPVCLVVGFPFAALWYAGVSLMGLAAYVVFLMLTTLALATGRVVYDRRQFRRSTGVPLLTARERRRIEQVTVRSFDWPRQIRRRRSLPDEAALLVVAEEVAEEIRRSPAWTNPALDDHRIRLDLDTELHQIAWTAHELADARRKSAVDVVDDGTADAARTRRASDQITSLLDEVHQALLDRLAALYRYRAGLRPMESMLANLAAVQGLRDATHSLSAELARTELATARITELTEELADIEAGLHAQIEYLRGTAVLGNLAICPQFPALEAVRPRG
ncbi:hypothetical protein [Nocardia transvalensis]|uniref:hypothetical protein n=1 Tax=Nocardia transvalensis TaxID=37333 RepID=UPI00189395F7|nr:hypothetical protein [Nocardia transvalensis]MBF6333568.1 hypothetical protein [Nocardia transvalensis]